MPVSVPAMFVDGGDPPGHELSRPRNPFFDLVVEDAGRGSRTPAGRIIRTEEDDVIALGVRDIISKIFPCLVGHDLLHHQRWHLVPDEGISLERLEKPFPALKELMCEAVGNPLPAPR